MEVNSRRFTTLYFDLKSEQMNCHLSYNSQNVGTKLLDKCLPKSFPKPDCLNPPKGAATSVLLYVLTKHVPASSPSATRSALKLRERKC